MWRVAIPLLPIARDELMAGYLNDDQKAGSLGSDSEDKESRCRRTSADSHSDQAPALGHSRSRHRSGTLLFGSGSGPSAAELKLGIPVKNSRGAWGPVYPNAQDPVREMRYRTPSSVIAGDA